MYGPQVCSLGMKLSKMFWHYWFSIFLFLISSQFWILFSSTYRLNHVSHLGSHLAILSLSFFLSYYWMTYIFSLLILLLFSCYLCFKICFVHVNFVSENRIFRKVKTREQKALCESFGRETTASNSNTNKNKQK